MSGDTLQGEQHNQSGLPLPEWQKLELAGRYDDYREGRMALHDWRETHAALRKSAEAEGARLGRSIL